LASDPSTTESLRGMRGGRRARSGPSSPRIPVARPPPSPAIPGNFGKARRDTGCEWPLSTQESGAKSRAGTGVAPPSRGDRSRRWKRSWSYGRATIGQGVGSPVKGSDSFSL